MAIADVSIALACDGVKHEIVLASNARPRDERSAVKYVLDLFEKIVMRDLHEVVVNAGTRRTLATGLLPVIQACEHIRENAHVIGCDKHLTDAVTGFARKLGLLAATAMDALADGEPEGSDLRYATYNELAAHYKKLGMAINDCIDDVGSTFPHAEIDLEHEPSTKHFAIPKRAAHASATGFCGAVTKSKRKLLRVLASMHAESEAEEEA